MKSNDTGFLVPDRIAKRLRSLHPRLKKKVRASLQTIAKDPEEGTPVHDKRGELRSLTVGRLRIVYRAPEGAPLEILSVGPREILYEETYRLVRKKETP